MELIAAPFRQIRTWSFILTVFLGSSGAILAMFQTFQDTEVISSTTAAILVTIITALTAAARFIVQNIPVTEAQKVALVSAAAAAPMKPGEDNVTVRIDSKKAVPSTPQ